MQDNVAINAKWLWQAKSENNVDSLQYINI